MELDLRMRVEAPASAVWSYLTEPVRMNEWSTAHIEGVRVGDGGTLSGVGALRRVTIPWPGLPAGRGRDARGSQLFEVVRCSEPPHRFVYHVIGGVPMLREHRGEITLATDTADATSVRWRVKMDFALPGMELVTRALVEPGLRRSLVALAQVARGASPVPLPKVRTLATASLAPLRRAAEQVLVEQRAIAARLQAAGDAKQWFALVYVLVTEEQLAYLDRGGVDHPEWVLRLLPEFHAHFADNLARFTRDPASAAAPWQKAWSLAEKSDPLRSPERVVRSLLLGVAAHIEADLPCALAAVYRAHFRDRCDFARFRADYLLMANLFRAASDRLIARMPKQFMPTWLRAARQVLPPELQDLLMRRYYDVAKHRLAAFEKGAALAAE